MAKFASVNTYTGVPCKVLGKHELTKDLLVQHRLCSLLVHVHLLQGHCCLLLSGWVLHPRPRISIPFGARGGKVLINAEDPARVYHQIWEGEGRVQPHP